ncbi:MAG: hypothetical protein ACRYF3_10155 [Janthinobacterium lividum]
MKHCRVEVLVKMIGVALEPPAARRSPRVMVSWSAVHSPGAAASVAVALVGSTGAGAAGGAAVVVDVAAEGTGVTTGGGVTLGEAVADIAALVADVELELGAGVSWDPPLHAAVLTTVARRSSVDVVRRDAFISSRPLGAFGTPVDPDGRSLARRSAGRTVNPMIAPHRFGTTAES